MCEKQWTRRLSDAKAKVASEITEIVFFEFRLAPSQHPIRMAEEAAGTFLAKVPLKQAVKRFTAGFP